jgi:hypothetical protein
VSATERLAGQVTRDWSALERVLSELRGRSADLLDEAASRHQRRLADELGRDVEAQRQALTRPLEESERQLEHLRRSVAGAETSLRDLRALLVFTELLSVASQGFWVWVVDTCGPRRWARTLMRCVQRWPAWTGWPAIYNR